MNACRRMHTWTCTCANAQVQLRGSIEEASPLAAIGTRSLGTHSGAVASSAPSPGPTSGGGSEVANGTAGIPARPVFRTPRGDTASSAPAVSHTGGRGWPKRRRFLRRCRASSQSLSARLGSPVAGRGVLPTLAWFGTPCRGERLRNVTPFRDVREAAGGGRLRDVRRAQITEASTTDVGPGAVDQFLSHMVGEGLSGYQSNFGVLPGRRPIWAYVDAIVCAHVTEASLRLAALRAWMVPSPSGGAKPAPSRTV